MKKIIKSEMFHDGAFHCARCGEFGLTTQGRTRDELIQNIKEGVSLHFKTNLRHWKVLIRAQVFFP